MSDFFIAHIAYIAYRSIIFISRSRSQLYADYSISQIPVFSKSTTYPRYNSPPFALTGKSAVLFPDRLSACQEEAALSSFRLP